jgi:dual specificity MAP kinase phosphatase
MQQGRAKVADLVTGGGPNSVQDAKEFYRSLIDSPVAATAVFVAYDDNTVDLKELPPTHPLRLLTESLLNSGHKTKFLKGGFQEFHSSYSALCSRPNESPSRPFLYSPTTPIVELDVDSAPMSQILPYLYIGNKHDAENRQILSSSHITHVLNVTSHIPLYFENDVTVTYLRVPASDSGSQNLKQYFDVAIEFIESVRCAAEGQCILVHCQAGVSRSPTLVLAYIMARYKLSLLDAFAFVKSRRQIIAPNFNFMGQLFDFEQHCRCGEVDLRLQDVDVVRPSDMAAASLAQHF